MGLVEDDSSPFQTKYSIFGNVETFGVLVRDSSVSGDDYIVIL